MILRLGDGMGFNFVGDSNVFRGYPQRYKLSAAFGHRDMSANVRNCPARGTLS